MKRPKKILSIVFKILVGLGSFGIIYMRLENDLTPERLQMISSSAASLRSLLFMALCLLLIPVNWGIEAHKWRLITAPIEQISYKTASKSVYSGVCLGNLAPGRATEFVAKIIFFHIGNRPKITVLHFVGGMFQLSVTIVVGFIALFVQLRHISGEAGWMVYATSITGTLLLIALMLAVYRIDWLLNVIARKISKDKNEAHFHYAFSTGLLLRLFLFSVLRYLVYYVQFVLLLLVFSPVPLGSTILGGIALYFLITTTIPMISVLEAAIRAAVALVVFKGAGVSDAALAITSILVWLTNIIVPSIAGYSILLRQNFNFKLFRSNRWSSRS